MVNTCAPIRSKWGEQRRTSQEIRRSVRFPNDALQSARAEGEILRIALRQAIHKILASVEPAATLQNL
jgi:hypothetical protein